MLDILYHRLKQGHRTLDWPGREPALPDRFRGRPVIEPSRCAAGCRACIEACPTGAITAIASGPALDLGRCLFCTDCTDACPGGAIRTTAEYRLAVRNRKDLILEGGDPNRPYALARALDRKSRRLFGRSLRLRQVSAGGCNACEADLNVLNTVVFDLGRFGVQFVASPRHADGLVVTGPVANNMRDALLATWEAVPQPRIVMAVGACAIAGGPTIGHPEVQGGAETLLPVDLYVPGCPPHPLTILDGILRLLGRLDGTYTDPD